MKTYVLEAIRRIKRFSEKFDVSTTLCDKTWVVFNDTGERELYIFQPDGSVIITKNGIGIKGKWEWIATNKSLVINSNDNVIMLHPEYIDKTILALNLDGTQKMAFLIEQGNKEAFAAKTLAQLEQFFVEKEKQLIDDENKRIERERLQGIEDERKRRDEERERLAQEERERKEEEAKQLKKEAKEIAEKLKPSWFTNLEWFSLIIGFIAGCVPGIFAAESIFDYLSKELVWTSNVDEDNFIIFKAIQYIEDFLEAIFFFIIKFGVPGLVLGLIAFGCAGLLLKILTTPVKPLARKKFEANLEKWHEENLEDKRYHYIEFDTTESDSK